MYLSTMDPKGQSNNFPDTLLQVTPAGPVTVTTSNIAMSPTKPGIPRLLVTFQPAHQGTMAGSSTPITTGMPLPSAATGGVLGKSCECGQSSIVMIGGIPADNNMMASINNMNSAQMGTPTPPQVQVKILG